MIEAKSPDCHPEIIKSMRLKWVPMDIITLTLYVANFFAPACFLSLAVSFINFNASSVEPLLGVGGRFLVNTIVGCAVMMGGLIYFGQDGKMATYAVLLMSVGTMQWVLTKGWHVAVAKEALQDEHQLGK